MQDSTAAQFNKVVINHNSKMLNEIERKQNDEIKYLYCTNNGHIINQTIPDYK